MNEIIAQLLLLGTLILLVGGGVWYIRYTLIRQQEDEKILDEALGFKKK